MPRKLTVTYIYDKIMGAYYAGGIGPDMEWSAWAIGAMPFTGDPEKIKKFATENFCNYFLEEVTYNLSPGDGPYYTTEM